MKVARAAYAGQRAGLSLPFRNAPRRAGLLVRSSESTVFPTTKDTEFSLAQLQDKRFLDEAAMKWMACLDKGIDEDEVISLTFGTSEAVEKYKAQIKARLDKRAAEIKLEEQERLERLAKSYVLGKEAYECGEYPAAVRLLTLGVEEAGPDTDAGGDCQLWLSLAFLAVGREQDAIDTCQYVADKHCNKKIRKQAADLLYILKAPKLEIGENERVTIPLLQSETWRKDGRKSGKSFRRQQPKKVVKETYWDKADWSMPLPEFYQLKWYYQVAWVVLLLAGTVYLNALAGSR